jgi:hypothetical protein
VETSFEVTARDLGHRATGVAAGFRRMFARDEAPDAVVEARVRSALGEVTSHPRAIEVRARGGRVTLCGPVLAVEVENVIRAAWATRGVGAVVNRLDVHPKGDGHPALQGGSPRTGKRPELRQKSWSPTARLLVGLGAGVLALRVPRHPGLAALAGGAVGAGLVAVALSQRPEAAGRRRGHGRGRALASGADTRTTWAGP